MHRIGLGRVAFSCERKNVGRVMHDPPRKTTTAEFGSVTRPASIDGIWSSRRPPAQHTPLSCRGHATLSSKTRHTTTMAMTAIRRANGPPPATPNGAGGQTFRAATYNMRVLLATGRNEQSEDPPQRIGLGRLTGRRKMGSGATPKLQRWSGDVMVRGCGTLMGQVGERKLCKRATLADHMWQRRATGVMPRVVIW